MVFCRPARPPAAAIAGRHVRAPRGVATALRAARGVTTATPRPKNHVAVRLCPCLFALTLLRPPPIYRPCLKGGVVAMFAGISVSSRRCGRGDERPPGTGGGKYSSPSRRAPSPPRSMLRFGEQGAPKRKTCRMTSEHNFEIRGGGGCSGFVCGEEYFPPTVGQGVSLSLRMGKNISRLPLAGWVFGGSRPGLMNVCSETFWALGRHR